MICPNCKTESHGAKWCPECGLRLEIEDIAGTEFNKIEKGDTQKLRPVSQKDENKNEASFSHSQRQNAQKNTGESPKNESRFSDRGFNYWIIAIASVAVFVVLFVILRLTGIIPTSTSPEPPVAKEEVVLEKEDSEKILETGLDQLRLGNYDEAETVFKAVLETDPKNNEAETLYQIVYNYNRALKKIQSGKYIEAREFFEKIPLDYDNYAIKTDIENLDEEIFSFENAYKTFEEVQKCMADARYEDALNTIELIDKNYLSGADSAMLDEYSAELKKFFERKEKADQEATDDMGVKKAEVIITEYLEDLVMAVNNKDFSIVEKHISGQLYNDQKKFVQTCIDSSLTQSFDMLKIKSIHPISDVKWKIDVSEGETVYYTDGTQKPETKDLTYTIEYIDSEYYLTSVE